MNDTEARIANLAQKLNLKFMVRKELKKLPAMLHQHERVANLAQGRYEGNEGLIVATDRGVMFIDEGLVRSHREDFPYERVSSVQTSTSMMSGKLVIFASGNKAQLENIMPKQQATALADHIRHQIAGGPAAPGYSSCRFVRAAAVRRPKILSRSCASSASSETPASSAPRSSRPRRRRSWTPSKSVRTLIAVGGKRILPRDRATAPRRPQGQRRPLALAACRQQRADRRLGGGELSSRSSAQQAAENVKACAGDADVVVEVAQRAARTGCVRAQRCPGDGGVRRTVVMAMGLMLLAAAAPTGAHATTCAAFRNQAQAQGAANTRDPDHDGIYCESLPCPCSTAERGGGTQSAPARRPKAQKISARITAVVDGDTIKVRAHGASRRSYTVRIIGIDTPETCKPVTPIECGGPQASAYMHRLALPGGRSRRVWLTTDPTQALFDRYRRLLAYVNARDSGSDIGRRMIRAGSAKVYVFNGVPFQRTSTYRASSKRARRARAGVFGRCRGNFHRRR